MPEGDQKTILVVEDEDALAKAMSLKLGHEGYVVHVAGDGQQALDWLVANTANLIVLDLVMPQVDGFMVLEELRNRGSQIPVLVISNLGQESDIQRAKELGAANFFVKSNTPLSQLVDYVRRLLV